jgi:hypothetical protein
MAMVVTARLVVHGRVLGLLEAAEPDALEQLLQAVVHTQQHTKEIHIAARWDEVERRHALADGDKVVLWWVATWRPGSGTVSKKIREVVWRI